MVAIQMTAKMTPEEMAAHIEVLEEKMDDQEKALKPIIEFFNAGRMLGKIMFVAGGMIVGMATIWGVISGWVGSHLK